jgi:diacylglycerol O-acyltransferase
MTKNGNRLPWGDALFLYLERDGMPMNIACVCVFAGEISLKECTEFTASKLPLLPRYTQRVATPPLNIGFPSWEDDPNFDIHNHIREEHLKHGTEVELQAVVGKILSSVMDRKQPLWDFTLVHGLKNHRTAVLVRVHHCLADGVAGLQLMNVLMDPSPDVVPLPSKKQVHRSPVRPPDALAQLLETWIGTCSDAVQKVLTTQSDILSLSQSMLAGSNLPADALGRFLPELTAPTERLFFNQTYQGPQKFAWAKIPNPAIKAIRGKCGGTHNDVILTVMTATIRRYVELHGDKVKGRLLRLMVPVSVRGDQNPNELGNRISLLPVTVPLGIRNPKKLLAAVHERTDFLKGAHIAEFVGLAGGLMGSTPAPLQAMVGPVASLLPITPFNLVCTNIRGPQLPVYLFGHKLLDWYPYVPVGGQMALNCAILSYNDVTFFGFSGDVHAAPDLRRLESLLELSFRELLLASGAMPPQKKKAKKATTARTAKAKSRVRSAVPPTVSSTPPEPRPPLSRQQHEAPVAMAAD